MIFNRNVKIARKHNLCRRHLSRARIEQLDERVNLSGEYILDVVAAPLVDWRVMDPALRCKILAQPAGRQQGVLAELETAAVDLALQLRGSLASLGIRVADENPAVLRDRLKEVASPAELGRELNATHIIYGEFAPNSVNAQNQSYDLSLKMIATTSDSVEYVFPHITLNYNQLREWRR